MFGNLTSRLEETFRRLRGRGKLSEADVDQAMREVRMALLEADVNYKVVKDFTAKVKERAKLDMLMDMLPELVEEGRKVLLAALLETAI